MHGEALTYLAGGSLQIPSQAIQSPMYPAPPLEAQSLTAAEVQFTPGYHHHHHHNHFSPPTETTKASSMIPHVTLWLRLSDKGEKIYKVFHKRSSVVLNNNKQSKIREIISICWTFLLKLTIVQNIRSQDMFCCNLATQWLIRILYSDRRMAWRPVMLISKLIGQKIAFTMLTPIRANREQRINDLNRILYNLLQISLFQDLTHVRKIDELETNYIWQYYYMTGDSLLFKWIFNISPPRPRWRRETLWVPMTCRGIPRSGRPMERPRIQMM